LDFHNFEREQNKKFVDICNSQSQDCGWRSIIIEMRQLVEEFRIIKFLWNLAGEPW